MGATAVTDSNFDKEVIQSAIPVLVDFWATWCGPCKAIGPIVDEMETKYAGKVKVLKMNTDENPKTPSQFNIRSIPTLLVFKNGKLFEQLVGSAPKDKIEGLITRSI